MTIEARQKFATVESLMDQITGALWVREDETPYERKWREKYARTLRRSLDDIMAAIILSSTLAQIDHMRTLTVGLPEIDKDPVFAVIDNDNDW